MLVISGAYANILKLVLDTVIYQDQIAYISGIYIGEITKSVLESMRDIKKMQEKATIILIDFSKAFDTISLNFIYNSIKIINFGNHLMSGIKLLLINHFSRINNAGHLSSGFTRERGVPQGHPISAYLFIIALYTLLSRYTFEDNSQSVAFKRVDAAITTTILHFKYTDGLQLSSLFYSPTNSLYVFDLFLLPFFYTCTCSVYSTYLFCI